MKWQQRWSAASTGRHMFDLKNSVSTRVKPVENIKMQRVISQLRTGYCFLNEYLHRVGIKDSPQCECGDPESVSHFIEVCEKYEECREKIRTRLFLQTGINDFSVKLFLEVREKGPFYQYREILNEALEEFIKGTERFDKPKSY